MLMGTWVTVTNTALGESRGRELWHRGLGLLPDGCNVHTGQHNQVGEGRVCHHVVHQDFRRLLPVHTELRPLEDLWGEQRAGGGSEGKALPSPEGLLEFCDTPKGFSAQGLVKTNFYLSSRGTDWCLGSEESQNC